MQREAALPCVAISGAAPASVAFELQRMGREWFTVECVPSPQHVMPSALALLQYVCNDAAEAGGVLGSAVPVLDIVCSGNSAREMMRRRDAERFDVAEPLQRLALLARLATFRSGQRAAGTRLHNMSGPFKSSSPYI